MRLVRYGTVESLIAAFWHFNERGMTLDGYLGTEFTAHSVEGAEIKYSGADEIAGHKARGFWGFCDRKEKAVRVWVSEGCDPAEIMLFLGHEIGHALGTPAEDEIAEEERADEYGEAARQAYLWLKELMPINNDNG